MIGHQNKVQLGLARKYRPKIGVTPFPAPSATSAFAFPAIDAHNANERRPIRSSLVAFSPCRITTRSRFPSLAVVPSLDHEYRTRPSIL